MPAVLHNRSVICEMLIEGHLIGISENGKAEGLRGLHQLDIAAFQCTIPLPFCQPYRVFTVYIGYCRAEGFSHYKRVKKNIQAHKGPDPVMNCHQRVIFSFNGS
ncbi:hypothetical protein D9M68_974690 [compost metagenome]